MKTSNEKPKLDLLKEEASYAVKTLRAGQRFDMGTGELINMDSTMEYAADVIEKLLKEMK